MSAARRVQPRYVDGVYAERNPTWHVEDAPWKAAQVRGMLARHRELAPRTICEIGCGAGAILSELERTLPSARRLVGYEISPQAHERSLGRRSQRLSFELADLLEEDPSVRFDLLLVLDVVEHVEDYLGFLRALRGRAAHTIVHLPLDLTALSLVRGKLAHWREQLGHLHYFTRQTAIASLEHAGFVVEDAFYAWHATQRPGSTGAALMAAPRRALRRLDEDLAQSLLGGASLVVLAR